MGILERLSQHISGRVFRDQKHGDAEEGRDLICVDDDAWRARIEILAPSDGLRVFLTTAKIRRHFSFEAAREDADRRLYSMTVLNGHTRLDLGGGVIANLHPKQAALFVSEEMRGVYDLPPQSRLRIAALSISIDRLRLMLGDRLAERMLPPHATRSFSVPMSSRLWDLSNSLFRANLRGPLRLIALEGVALQIFAQHASILGLVSDASLSSTKSDRKSIQRARQRLCGNLIDPPTIADLAMEFGMTEQELNDGFRKQYGLGVHEVLRRARLRYARMLIKNGATSIKEVAYECGYRYPANFSTAFRQHYGVQPSSLLAPRATRTN
jgi:AraC-like DNA-binding protein